MRFPAAVLLVLAFAASTGHARPGAEIPLPDVSLPEALVLAKADLVGNERLLGRKYAKPVEYIVTRAEYRKDDQGRRVWWIEFVHPVFNDHSAQYEVGMDKTVRLVEVTQ